MFFKKRNKIKEFLESPIINNVERKITSLLNVELYTESNNKIELLIKEEIKQSGIKTNTLLKEYINSEKQLIDFCLELYSNEKTISKIDNDEISKGLGKWFSITYFIYFYYLSNSQLSELNTFLKLRQIPKSDNFLKRLKKYFNDSQINY